MKNEGDFIEKLRSIFVDWNTFNLRISPVEKIIYGVAGALGLAAVGVLASLIFRKP